MGRNEMWSVVLLGLLLQATLWAGSPGESGIDIEAPIPRLAKHGHLRAIRRGPGGSPPFGRPEYQVLEMDGDRTVRQQVIARYLSAEVEAAALPLASVAIATANYRYRYRGSIADGGTLAYIFEI